MKEGAETLINKKEIDKSYFRLSLYALVVKLNFF